MSGPSEGLKTELLSLLATLSYYRFFGVLALGFAVWSFRGRPRWPAWVALAASGVALLVSAITMWLDGAIIDEKRDSEVALITFKEVAIR